MVHAHAPHQIYTGIYCTNNVLSNLPYFAGWVVATTQTASKINIRSRCVAWKEWAQNSNYNSNIFEKSIFVGGSGTAVTRFCIWIMVS